MKKKIFFRADGNSKIGLGHVSRALALAEIIKENFFLTFLIQNPSSDLKNQILKVCDELIELPVSADLEAEAIFIRDLIQSQGILVLDGYSYDFSYQKILKLKSIRLVCIDDIYSTHFLSDVIINHTSGIKIEQYKAEFYTRFYLGAEYAILRLPFLKIASEQRIVQKIETVFVNFGGADPENYTFHVVKELAINNSFKGINVVLGSAYLYFKELEELIDSQKLYNLRVYKSLGIDEILDLMKQSQVAICSSSTIAYEYCCIGGALFVIKTAENQKDLYKFLIENNLAKDWRSFDEAKIDIIYAQQAVVYQKRIFNGNSRKNLKNIFKQLLSEDQVKFRRATVDDMKVYFDWANDPLTRGNSINKEKIEWSSHQKWFKNKLSDDKTLFFVFSLEDNLIGQLRFDFLEGYWLISFSVDEKFRGKGLAEIIVYKSILQIKKIFDADLKLKAQVQEDNIASLKIFQHLGFTNIGNEIIERRVYLNFIKCI
jgi:UDP-2,4-diacetamido-2,4,6-trideoxy-beta-L-altropyranose hydrolase